jgi:hypothetical protein
VFHESFSHGCAIASGAVPLEPVLQIGRLGVQGVINAVSMDSCQRRSYRSPTRVPDDTPACRCACRSLRLDLPCPELLEPTLHYLYTGVLPAEVSDVEVLFGLMTNAKFLLCEELTSGCFDTIRDRILDGNFAAIVNHGRFGPELVPVDFITDMLTISRELGHDRTVAIACAWMDRAEGLPDADRDRLRALIIGAIKEATDETVADVCNRFPGVLASLGPDLVVALAGRVTALVGKVRQHGQPRRTDWRDVGSDAFVWKKGSNT